MANAADKRVIACNFNEGTPPLPLGAKAFVINVNGGSACDRIEVLARSRSGRWIEKWEAIWRLANFRLVTLPPEHPPYSNDRIAANLDQGNADWMNELSGKERAKRGIPTVDFAQERREHAKAARPSTID